MHTIDSVLVPPTDAFSAISEALLEYFVALLSLNFLSGTIQ
jgi:hypothetical protein